MALFVYPAQQGGNLVVALYNAESGTPTNDAPTFSGLASHSIAENAAFSANYTIDNMDGEVPTLSGVDAALFSLVNVSGDVYALSMAAQNFEAPNDADANNNYQVTINANDGVNQLVTLDVVVAVTNVNEGFWQFAPPSTRIVSFS